MYCPQCGLESSSEQHYCRSCGANLRVIGKAVALSEAIARSDRGPLPKLKEMMRSAKVEQVTEEISRALDQMNQEIARLPAAKGPELPRAEPALSVRLGKTEKAAGVEKTAAPAERRENQIAHGAASLFSGIALMIFLYHFAAALVLKIPPGQLAKIPFEVDPLLPILWLVGLIPALSGLGRIVAGLLTRPAPSKTVEGGAQPPPEVEREFAPEELAGGVRAPGSVVEHTTKTLGQKIPVRRER